MNDQYTAIIIIICIILVWYLKQPEHKSDFLDDVIISPSYGIIESITEKNGKIHIIIKSKILDNRFILYPINGIILSQTKSQLTILDSFDEEIVLKKLSRDIVNIPSRKLVGEHFNAGKELGISVMPQTYELIIPHNCKIFVNEGEKVYGSCSIIGCLNI